MTDNIDITPGTGKTIATDDCGASGHIQLFKLAYSADGVATLVGVDANGLDVDVTRLPALPAGSNAIGKLAANSGVVIGDVNVATFPSLPAGNNNIGDVDLASSIPAGTNAIGQTDPRGNVAHDGVDSGNPIKTGARARTALPVAVSADDRADTISDKFGRTVVTDTPLDNHVDGKANYTNTTAADVIAAGGANTQIVVTSVLVVNGHATVGTKVTIRDGTTAKIVGFASALGGGFQLADKHGLFVASTNTAVTAVNTTTGSDVDVFVSGYKIPS